MLYLLGGTPRSGKSTIARRFLSETNVPFFPLDLLVDGFIHGFPEYGIGGGDELTIGEQLWPIIKPIATIICEDKTDVFGGKLDYLIEGAQLHPKNVAELCAQFPKRVRACFIGFADIDTMAKFDEIRCFGGERDWLRNFDNQSIIKEIERLKAFSANLRDECKKHGVRYFEISTNRQQMFDTVIQYLKG